MRKNIRILDCTLRDGGCINNFNFGDTCIQQIKSGLEQSKINIIECGYIDEKNGSPEGRTQYIDDRAMNHALKSKRRDTLYVAMFDHGKFDPARLSSRTKSSIDGIRVAFHKKDWRNALKSAKTVLEKGYCVFIQPMLILRYSDSEIIELVQTVNDKLPQAEALYIVDSFGEMRQPDLERIYYLIDHNLKPQICIGFHSHNNLQLSYSNAIHLIEKNSDRNLIIDSSVMGMGKGAGNLNTELLLDHMNHYYGTNYVVQPLLDIIDKVLNQIYFDYKWGYSIEYFLSAMHSCTPSYAKHFFSKHLMSIEQIGELLSQISEEKKISFDRQYADELYFAFNSVRFDDEIYVKRLSEMLSGKKILLLGPGKSITKFPEKINAYLTDPSICSIALNAVDFYHTDFLYTNKVWLYEDAKRSGITPIILSNIAQSDNNAIILEYEKWSKDENRILESSFEVILHLLSKMQISQVFLAGFDGFSFDNDENYYKSEMKRVLTKEEVLSMNKRTTEALQRYQDQISFTFITPTKYAVWNNGTESPCPSVLVGSDEHLQGAGGRSRFE